MPVTLLSLRQQAKDRTDMQNASFVSDSNWNIYLNYALGELYDLIVKTDHTAIVSSTAIAAVSGQSIYSFPLDMYKLSRIYEQDGSGRIFSMDSMSAHDLSDQYFADYFYPRGHADSRYRYYIENLTFEIRPVPTGPVSFLVKYVPQFAQLDNDLSSINYPIVPGWEEYVVLGAVIRAYSKEGTDSQNYAIERARYEKRVIDMASEKDRFSPRRIRDVYGSTRRNFRYYLPQR